MIWIIVLIIFAFGLFCLLKLKSPKWKGAIGESKVARTISKLPEQEYRVLNNIYLKTKTGTSQIDHIVVSIYGIFVIETKNYGGWIFGSENQEYWRQIIYNYKNKFRNPIKQNWGHIYALRNLLCNYIEYEEYMDYFPIIVFTGNAELKSITSNIPVIYDNELLETIMNYRKTPIISFDQMNDIVMKIARNNLQNKDIDKKHIQNIYNRIYEKEQNSLSCPRCDGNLIIRNGEYGKFYGCSNYPNCRYTKNC